MARKFALCAGPRSRERRGGADCLSYGNLGRSAPLLAPERDHGLDSRGAARGHEARERRDDEQQQRDVTSVAGSVGLTPNRNAPKRRVTTNDAARPRTMPERRELQRAADYVRNDRGRRRAERHPQPISDVRRATVNDSTP